MFNIPQLLKLRGSTNCRNTYNYVMTEVRRIQVEPVLSSSHLLKVRKLTLALWLGYIDSCN